MSTSTAEEFLDIGTPENVVFGYEVAGIGSRFLAALVDTILIALLLVIVNFILIFVMSRIDPSLGAGGDAAVWLIAILGLISFVILWGYYIFFEMLWNGQSPGKRMVGLRVIRTDGTPMGVSESIIRNLIRLIDFLPLYYGVGVIAMFISHRAQRLGDLAANTLVVYERGVVTLESLAADRLYRALAPEGALAALPLERLSTEDAALATSFLQRRGQFANEEQLARQLASALMRRMEAPPELANHFTPLELLRTIAAYQSNS